MAEDYAAQLSVKVGATGNIMINLRAQDVPTLASMANELADLGPVILSSAEEFAANATIVQTFPGTQVVGTTTVDPLPTGNTTPVCAHGVPMTYKAGTSTKTGKPYKMFFCDVTNDPRMLKCQAKFLND